MECFKTKLRGNNLIVERILILEYFLINEINSKKALI